MSKHENREKELRLAIKRIEVGRPTRIKAGRLLSISSLANEVGIDPSTIHTRYPAIAELVRQKSGRSEGERRKEKASELKAAKEKNSALRCKVEELETLLASVTSKYAVALSELSHMRTVLESGGKVVSIRGPSRKL